MPSMVAWRQPGCHRIMGRNVISKKPQAGTPAGSLECERGGIHEGIPAGSGLRCAMPREGRDERILTPRAFERLLEWLDDGAESCGETYLEMRRRLVFYFDRRNRPFPD